MSIALMTLAWKSSFQAGKKLVLLALCDNANDQGECFPSVSMLVEKCSMSERSVFNHIADLEKDGAIKRNSRTGRSTIYQIDPCKFCTPEQSLTPATVAGVQALTPANSAPTPLQILHPTPATVAPTPATVAPITIKEPSSNHQIEPNTKTRKAFVLPDWIDAEAWSAFMTVRAKKKAASTDYALKLIVKTLTTISEQGHDPMVALNNSIKSGWTDVYAPRSKSDANGKPLNKQQALESRNRAVAQRWAEGEVMPGAI
jgi:hypothetical protein